MGKINQSFTIFFVVAAAKTAVPGDELINGSQYQVSCQLQFSRQQAVSGSHLSPGPPLSCQSSADRSARPVGCTINSSVQVGFSIFDDYVRCMCQHNLDVAVFVYATTRAVNVG